MTIEIIQTHTFQIGDVSICFTVGRVGKETSELPGGADEAGGFDSRSLTEIEVKRGFESRPASLRGAKGGPTGMGRSDSVERHAPISPSAGAPPPAPVEQPGEAPPPVSSGAPIRPVKPLRPHCLRPENCGGYGRKHCGSCERASAETEAA